MFERTFCCTLAFEEWCLMYLCYVLSIYGLHVSARVCCVVMHCSSLEDRTEAFLQTLRSLGICEEMIGEGERIDGVNSPPKSNLPQWIASKARVINILLNRLNLSVVCEKNVWLFARISGFYFKKLILRAMHQNITRISVLRESSNSDPSSTDSRTLETPWAQF